MFLFKLLGGILICCCCCSFGKLYRLCATPWTTAYQAPLSFTVSQSWLKRVSIESVILSNHLICVTPFSSSSQLFPASGFFLARHLFASSSQRISFSLSIRTSNEYSGLISFRIDWSDLPPVPGTLKSLLQHHSSNITDSSALGLL